MPSRASIMGHPIHPMLVVFPTGLYPISLLFDVVWFFTGNFLWLNLAFWTMALGLLFTFIAAIPGYVDYNGSIEPQHHARVTAVRHMWNGIAIMVTYTIALALRWAGGGYSFGMTTPDINGTLVMGSVILNLVGNALVGVQGYLGGALVYKHGVGVADAYGSARPGSYPDE